MIPSRSRLNSETYLVTGLGVSHYISNFEAEVAAVSENTRIISSGSTIIRITENLETSEPPPDARGTAQRRSADNGETAAAAEGEEPVPGPSGCQHRHRRRSASRPTEYTDQNQDQPLMISISPSAEERKLRRRRRCRRQRRRYRHHNHQQQQQQEQHELQAAANPSWTGRAGGKTYVRSVESSPGRDSPSPASLARIVLYWERVKVEQKGQTRTRSLSADSYTGEVAKCGNESVSSPEYLITSDDSNQ